MIVFTARVVTPRRKGVEILRSMEALLEPTRAQPGCRGCNVYLDMENPGAVLLREEWASRPDLERHLRSDYYRTVLAAIELSEEAPEIHFDTIESRAGMEVIEQARGRRT